MYRKLEDSRLWFWNCTSFFFTCFKPSSQILVPVSIFRQSTSLTPEKQIQNTGICSYHENVYLLYLKLQKSYFVVNFQLDAKWCSQKEAIFGLLAYCLLDDTIGIEFENYFSNLTKRLWKPINWTLIPTVRLIFGLNSPKPFRWHFKGLDPKTILNLKSSNSGNLQINSKLLTDS